jgi:hypothetical protein
MATAATVELHESQGLDPHSVQLEFKAASGEGNRLTVSIVGESSDYYDVRLVDSAAILEPVGSGCSGGGAPGTALSCTLHKPAWAQMVPCGGKFGCPTVPGSQWDVSMRFVLGSAESHFDAGAMARPAGSVAPPIPMTIVTGPGNDRVITSDTKDVVEASAGDDFVRTGAGEDTFMGGAAADGADDVDLGTGIDLAEYKERSTRILFQSDDLANDGALGEGDKLIGGEEFESGSGDDFLLGSPVAAIVDLMGGGPGNDTLRGGRGQGEDLLAGGPGRDRIYGAEGADLLGGSQGSDQIYGGSGGDEINGWTGNDIVRGGAGPDEIELGDGTDRGVGGKGPDDIDCGRGDGDKAWIDPIDRTRRCELYTRLPYPVFPR